MNERNYLNVAKNGKINNLENNQLNFVEVIALSVAIIAPTFAMSMNVGLMASTVSYSVSMVFLVSTILMGSVAVSFVKFNEYFPSAGSVYTFTEKSLGENAASISGWTLSLTYIAFSAGCSSAFGSLFASFVKDLTGLNISWIIFALICEVLIWFISYTDIKLSTNIMLVIESISILLVILIAVIILIKVGSTKGLSLIPFKRNGNTFSNFGTGIVYAILCFGGFEGASSLGEESKNPKKSIPLAIASTVVITGIVFIFVSYAEVIGFGVSDSGIQALKKSPSTIVELSKNYMGSLFTILITLAISISAFSTALGSMTAGSRLLYSMSKDGNIPKAFSNVHPEHHTPYIALNIILAIIIIPVLALFKHDGVEVFGYIGTIGALALLIAYFITSLGSLIYFGKRKIWTWQLFIPIVALFVLAFTFYSNIYPIPQFPNNIFPYIVLTWIIAGCIITFIYKRANLKTSVQ